MLIKKGDVLPSHSTPYKETKMRWEIVWHIFTLSIFFSQLVLIKILNLKSLSLKKTLKSIR